MENASGGHGSSMGHLLVNAGRALPPFTGTLIAAITVFVTMALASFALADASRTPTAEALRVRFDERAQTISVLAQAVPLTRVLEKIGHATDIEITLHRKDHGNVTADFQNIALEDALRQLIGNRSLVVARTPGTNRIERLWVLTNLGTSEVLARSPSKPDRAAVSKPVQPAAVMELLQQIEISGAAMSTDAKASSAGDYLLDRLAGSQLPNDRAVKPTSHAMPGDLKELLESVLHRSNPQPGLAPQPVSKNGDK